MGDLTVIVGLGNPGRMYRLTRHNAGFLAVMRLAEQNRIGLDSRKFKAVIGQGRLAGQKVLLALPETFMNLSGEAVAPLLGYFKVEPEDLIVVHDDVDLLWGRLKVKQGGGTGGHRGLSSLIGQIGSDRFNRIRIGVGRPEETDFETSDWVLSRFTQEEQENLPQVLDRAALAANSLLTEGLLATMNRFNAKPADDD